MRSRCGTGLRNSGAGKGAPPIVSAARRGNIAILRSILAASGDVNQAGGIGQTALHTAAYYGHALFVAALLSAGAAIDPETTITANMSNDHGGRSLSPSPSPSHTRTHTCARKHTHTRARTHKTHTHTHSHTHSLTHSLTHTLTHSHTCILARDFLYILYLHCIYPFSTVVCFVFSWCTMIYEEGVRMVYRGV